MKWQICFNARAIPDDGDTWKILSTLTAPDGSTQTFDWGGGYGSKEEAEKVLREKTRQMAAFATLDPRIGSVTYEQRDD